MSESATARWDRLHSRASEQRAQLGPEDRASLEGGQPNCVGVGHPRALRLGEGRASFHREREPPTDPERPWISPRSSISFSGKRKHGLEQEHNIELPARDRWDPGDLEATGKIAGTLTRDLDGAGAQVHPQIGAPQLPSDEPPGTGDSAAQVEHGAAGCNAGAAREGEDLPGTHEAFLVDEFAGPVRGNACSLQGPLEWRALVLLHGNVSTRRRARDL